MSFFQVAILAVIQGFAELLPVSSSAHVIFAQHLMGLDASAPEMTFLLVMLHTGTMFAVLIYFWQRWKILFENKESRAAILKALFVSTAVTGIIGLGAKIVIEKIILEHWLGYPKGEVEHLFKIIPLVAIALFAAGILILWSSKKEHSAKKEALQLRDAFHIGWVQGVCLPFRGFSRSGATISAAMALGIQRMRAEEYSFALAVLLTPPVIVLQLRRLMKARASGSGDIDFAQMLTPGLFGMVCSFIAGLIALRWLSSWLEKGRWKVFGYYCLAFSSLILILHFTNLI